MAFTRIVHQISSTGRRFPVHFHIVWMLIVSRVEEIAKKKGVTMAQIATAWIMAKDGEIYISSLLGPQFDFVFDRNHCTHCWHYKP